MGLNSLTATIPVGLVTDFHRQSEIVFPVLRSFSTVLMLCFITTRGTLFLADMLNNFTTIHKLCKFTHCVVVARSVMITIFCHTNTSIYLPLLNAVFPYLRRTWSFHVIDRIMEQYSRFMLHHYTSAMPYI